MVEDSLKISQFDRLKDGLSWFKTVLYYLNPYIYASWLVAMQKHSLNASITRKVLTRNYTVPPPTSTSGLAVDANRFNDVLGEGQRRQFTEVGGDRLEAERRVVVDILQ